MRYGPVAPFSGGETTGADLHIHVLEGVTEDDLRVFFSNTLGSKWFNPRPAGVSREPSWGRVAESPQVWVGEVSWLKAGVTGDDDTYVPHPVQAVHELIGEDLPVLDEALLKKLEVALKIPNQAGGYETTAAEKVVAFLKEHMGKRLFTVSW